MDVKPHYFKIGIFVLIAVALLVAAIVIFGAGLLGRDQFFFESYFAESITGLSVGAVLEFRGVRIGQVADIDFVGSVYDLPREQGRISPYATHVRVVTAVPRARMPDFAAGRVEEALQQMVDRGMRVRITTNILTGLAYLEINYFDPERFPVEEIPWTSRHPVIPSAPGELTTIRDSVDKILTQIQAVDVEGVAVSLKKLFTTLDAVISEIDVGDLSREVRALLQAGRQTVEGLEMEKINASTLELLATLRQAVAEADLPHLSRRMNDLLATVEQKLAALNVARINADIEQLLDTLNQAVVQADVPALSQEAQSLIGELRSTNRYLADLLAPPEEMVERPNLPEIVDQLSRTISQLNRVLATERPEIEAILSGFREAVDSLNDLVAGLRERPSDLLFGRPPPRSEVLR
jgi:paraquat-inducible protein B